MKKIISFIAAALLAAGCLSSCAAWPSPAKPGEIQGKIQEIQIVTTIFPEYDWVMNILGDNPAGADVILLLDNGIDLHNYQPSVDDILKISTCDLFIYVGGESDEWVDGALKEAMNKDMTVINLLDELGGFAKEEEIIEGMQGGEDHGHEGHEDDDHEHDHDDHGHDAEYDEHVWLSLKNAAIFTEVISEAIQDIDKDNADYYGKNAADYIEKLNALDSEYEAAVSDASFDALLFGDRFPFRYLVDDYGLSYYAAFAGCSAETEASFETIFFLAQKTDELSLPAVITIEGTNHRIAETIIRNTNAKNQQVLIMDSMQAVTAKDIKNGATYLSIMEKNLSVLKEALK